MTAVLIGLGVLVFVGILAYWVDGAAQGPVCKKCGFVLLEDADGLFCAVCEIESWDAK